LYIHKYYTNTIVKLHQIMSRFPDHDDCGEVYFYLGKSFEQISETGQAVDAYKESIMSSNPGCPDSYKLEAENAMKRLKEMQE